MNTKFKENPDMLKHRNPKNSKTVFKGLNDICEDAYAR